MINFHLDELLFRRKMTQSALSELTGIRPGTINEIYHNIAERVGVEQLNKICNILECHLTDLMEYTPDKKF